MAVGRSVGSVFVAVRGDGSKLGSDMEGVGDKSGRRFGKGFNRGVRALKIGTAAAALAAAAFAKMSVSAAADFQKKMNEVFTLMPDASQKAMDAMSGQVLGFANKMGILPEKVIPALYQALSAGVPQNNVFDFMETAQKAALGGVTDLETAVDGISSAVNAYGADVLTASKASDDIFTAVRLGKTTFDEMSRSLFNVTPVAAALGVSFDDVAGGLAAITAQGTPTSVAATQMRQLFVELSKAGGAAAATFQKAAGKSFQAYIAGGGDVTGALDVMSGAAKKSGLQIQDMFSSVEAGQAALQLAGNKKFVAAVKEMGSSAGATDKAYGQMDQGIARASDRMAAKWSVMKVKAGDALAPTIEKMMDFALVWAPKVSAAVSLMVTKVRGWLEKNRATFELIFDRIETIVTNVVDAMVAAWAIFGGTITSFSVDVLPTIRDGIEAMVSILDGLLDFVAAVFTGRWRAAWDAFLQVVVGVWHLIGGLFEEGRLLVKLVVSLLIDAVKKLWDWSFLSDWTDAAVGAVVDTFRGLGPRMWSLLKAAWDFLIGKWEAMSPINLGSKIIGAIPGGTTGFGMIGNVLGRIPGFASGAVLTKPTLFMGGEGSSPPEIVTPQSMMADTFRRVLAQAGGGGGVSFAAGAIQVSLASGSPAEAERAGRTVADIVAARLDQRRGAVMARALAGAPA